MKKKCLLDAALQYLAVQQPVIAVGADKRPHRPGWNTYFTRPQTEDEVREQFSNGAWGIAKILYPACESLHLDFDGPHSEEAWLATKITLPETARQRTPSGGFHLIFKTSDLLRNTSLKRKVRLVEAHCECEKSCGVDFLIRGYALVPPSPGYREEVALEYAAEIPDEVIHLASEKREQIKGPRFGSSIPEGKRNVTLLSIGGVHRREGMEYDELIEALLKVNKARCKPPLTRSDVEKIAKSLCRYEPAEKEQPKTKPSFVAIESIQREHVEWLWPNRIPMGRLTLVGGDPESGKSFLTENISATVSRGEALPGGTKPSGPSYVVLLATEDGFSDTVRPRLESMQADLSKIIVPDPAAGLIADPFAFVEATTKHFGPALVVIDPVVAFTGKADTSKAWEVREFLSPLMALAGRRGFACILVCHLNKQSASKAMYRNSGSIDFVAACRSAFIVAEDPETPGRRVLAHIKNSLAPRQPSLSFYIDEGGFRWGEEVAMTADELLSAGPSRSRERQQLETAMKFLERVLADGPLPSEKIKEKAKAAGIANRTIFRAKEELNVKARKERFGAWWWTLPTLPSEDET